MSMQKNGRHDNSLCTGIKSGIEILSVNKKEMTLSGNHVKGGGSYESPSLYMGHVVERCADRSTGRLLQISYVVHVVLIPAFFLVINPSVQYETKWVSERSVWMLRSDALLQYSFFYSGDNDYRNSVVSFCNTALLLIRDFFSAPLANQKEARYNMTK